MLRTSIRKFSILVLFAAAATPTPAMATTEQTVNVSGQCQSGGNIDNNECVISSTQVLANSIIATKVDVTLVITRVRTR